MREETQTPTVTKTYLHYLVGVIQEFKSIRTDYAQWRAGGKKDPTKLTTESIAPIMAKIAIGLQRGSIVSTNPSENQINLEKVKKIIVDIQTKIKESMVPTLQIDPKTKKITTVFSPSILERSIFEDIRTLLSLKNKKLQINTVIFNVLYKEPTNKKISKDFLKTIKSFLDFDKKQSQRLRVQQPTTVKIIVKIPPALWLKRCTALQEKLRMLLNFTQMPNEFLKKSIELISEVEKAKPLLDTFINSDKLTETIVKWKELSTFFLKAYNGNIDAYFHRTRLDVMIFRMKENKKLLAQVTFIPPKSIAATHCEITLEQAEGFGIITKKQSEEIKEIVHKKQQLCQMLQDATPEPEPFLWVENFPEPKL